MYTPESFRIKDHAVILDVMRRYSFATLVTGGEEGPEVTHLPLIAESETPLVLAGHMAKANPHWRVFDGKTIALAIFQGPHTYISPSWYVTKPNVPTWNYVAVHAYGRPQILKEPEEVAAHLRLSVATFDPHLTDTNPESVGDELVHKMMAGVVAFRVVVDRLEAKAKLNQNKQDIDRLAVLDRLAGSEEEELQRMAAMMRSGSVSE